MKGTATDGSPDTAIAPPSPYWFGLLVASVLLSMGVTSYAASVRLPWTDEASFASAAYNLAHNGFLGTTVLDPAGNRLPRINERTYWVMPGYLLLEAGWYKMAPASIWCSRFFTIILTPLLAWVAYLFVRSLLADALAAVMAASALVLSYNYLWIASWARPEVLCLVLGIGAMAVYLSWREQFFDRAILTSQTLVCASGLVHPNGLLHFLGLALLVFVLDWRRIRFRTFLVALAPYVVLGGLYGLYVIRDVSAFRAQLGANAINNDRFASSWNPVRLVWLELHERYFRAYGLLSGSLLIRAKVIDLLAYAGAIVATVMWRPLRSKSGVRLTLGLTALYFAVQCVFNQKLTIYLVHIELFYAILFSALLAYAWRRWPASRAVVGAVFAGLLLFQSAGMVAGSGLRSYHATRGKVVRAIRAHSSTASWIDASTSFWFSLDHDVRLRYDPTLGLASGRWPDVIVLDQFTDEVHEGMARDHPAQYAQVMVRLSSYRNVYESDGYRIFVRPAGEPGAAASAIMSPRYR